ncbi:MAG: transporter [Gemmatimonadota bacterium]|nr:transporter [Gemmatimonadota bacterium]
MMRCSVGAAIASVLVIGATLHAQEQPDPRAVQPERPTVATHAHTVAPGYFELETGAEGDRVSSGTRAWFAPNVLKVGVSSHTQLNVGGSVYTSGAGKSSGVGDVTVGLKWRVLDDHPVLGDFALLPAIKFANGSADKGTGTGTRDLGLTAIVSRSFGSIGMDLNAVYTRVGATGATPATDAALWTASFGFPVAGQLSWVAEVFGAPTIDGSDTPSSAALLTGPTWLVSPAFNLDVGVITPLRGELTNALYAGLVWNMGSPFLHMRRP